MDLAPNARQRRLGASPKRDVANIRLKGSTPPVHSSSHSIRRLSGAEGGSLTLLGAQAEDESWAFVL